MSIFYTPFYKSATSVKSFYHLVRHQNQSEHRIKQKGKYYDTLLAFGDVPAGEKAVECILTGRSRV
jgi:hypothetical protein